MKTPMIRRILALLGLTAFAAVLLLIPAYLYADSLYRELFDARIERTQEQAETMTYFDLSAEENEHQTEARISAWLNTVSSQEVGVKSTRGMLQAAQYEPVDGGEAAPWAIVFHGGLGTDRRQVIDIACVLSIHGYRVLTPDLFAHGKSEGDASTLGFGDAQDVHAWVEYVEKTQMNAEIVLFGLDEGAAAVLTAACEGLNDSVAAVAADSACNDGAWRMLSLAGAEAGGIEAEMLGLMFRKRTGGAEGKLSERIAQAALPALLIHGTGDQDVPAWHSEDIALASGENVSLYLVEGAGHGLSRFVDPQAYYEKLLGFFGSAVKN